MDHIEEAFYWTLDTIESRIDKEDTRAVAAMARLRSLIDAQAAEITRLRENESHMAASLRAFEVECEVECKSNMAEIRRMTNAIADQRDSYAREITRLRSLLPQTER
jgi:hypothetical protein